MSLSREAISVGKDAWYYEDRRGIWVIAQLKNKTGGHIGYTRVRITRGKLEKTLRRMRKTKP